MLLLDSSVWIDRSRGAETQATRYVDMHEDREEIALTGIVYQEVLQGARSERGFEQLREMLSAMLLLEPREWSTYEIAAILYRRARSAGLTVRKPNDCLIAAIALEHGALLVHNDRDFFALAQAEPALMIYPSGPH
jgi:predicted nucleic acid-binding protein